MALPPHHPLWAAWIVILPIALLSALVVYARAGRLAAPAVVRAYGLHWVRRNGSFGCAAFAIVLGILFSLLYGVLRERAPAVAPAILLAVGVSGTVLAAATLTLLRLRQKLPVRGDWFFLLSLWGIGYGLLLPMVVT